MCLVNVALVGFVCLGVILFDILLCEKWPSDKVSSFDCIGPSQLHWLATYCMH